MVVRVRAGKGPSVRIRIIAGRLGGRSIIAPKGNTTHPMSERIRNAMFNSIGEDIKDALVLDAFAGSGAIGIEALSRGAKRVTFVERDRITGRVLDENVEMLDLNSRSLIIHSNIRTWCNNTEERYDIIFADPPYKDPQFSTVERLFPLLKTNGLMVLSYPGRGEAPTDNGVVVVDNRSYGTAALAFYRKKDA